MSSYFDDIGNRIGACAEDDTDGLRDVERKLVRDVTICAMWPGFPEDLRKFVHQTVIKYGIDTLPVLATPADFETINDAKRLLLNMNGDLHSIWHEVAQRGLGRDHPADPLDRLCGQAEQEREEMVLDMPVWVCPSCDRYGAGMPMLGCSRCGAQVAAGNRTFREERSARGDDVKVWECVSAGHKRIASRDEPTCSECGGVCCDTGYTVIDARNAQWELRTLPAPTETAKNG